MENLIKCEKLSFLEAGKKGATFFCVRIAEFSKIS